MDVLVSGAFWQQPGSGGGGGEVGEGEIGGEGEREGGSKGRHKERAACCT